MDDLTDFVANTVEFIVSGVLFAVATSFLFFSISGTPHIGAHELAWLRPAASLLIIGSVAFAYAMGVVAESFARATFELMLDRVTVRRPEFQGHPDTRVAAAPDVRTRWKQRALGRRPQAGRGGHYTVQDCRASCDERERQRTVVMTLHPALYAEVQSQLKRLRLERVFALASCLVTVGFLFRHELVHAILALAATVLIVWSVHSRFRRYCGSIARGFKTTNDRSLMDRASELGVIEESRAPHE